MGKGKNNNRFVQQNKAQYVPKLKNKFYPMVSLCTPTFNRRPFIPMAIECFKNQTYPKDRMEWIIVDDGTDSVEDLFKTAAEDYPQIRYIRCPKRMNLGEKRNYMHTFVKGTIIVYMDDDDYYPPERVEHAVDTLQNNREAMCAGSSEIYVYFKNLGNRMVQCGPYGPNHATAGTFAFRTELLKTSRYEDHAALAEEKHFLKNYTVPFVQLDPLKTILVFSHEHNTFDKRKLLQNANPQVIKDSDKTVEHFIRRPEEAEIKRFFLQDIDALLENYSPGTPDKKPDVLEQIRKIELEREKMMQQHNQQQQNQNQGKLMMQRPGEKPRVLTGDEITGVLNQQKNEIFRLQTENEELKKQLHIFTSQSIVSASKSEPEAEYDS